MGRDWLEQIQLDWRKIGAVVMESQTPVPVWNSSVISTRRFSRMNWALSEHIRDDSFSKKKQHPSFVRLVQFPTVFMLLWKMKFIVWSHKESWNPSVIVSGQLP